MRPKIGELRAAIVALKAQLLDADQAAARAIAGRDAMALQLMQFEARPVQQRYDPEQIASLVSTRVALERNEWNNCLNEAERQIKAFQAKLAVYQTAGKIKKLQGQLLRLKSSANG